MQSLLLLIGLGAQYGAFTIAFELNDKDSEQHKSSKSRRIGDPISANSAEGTNWGGLPEYDWSAEPEEDRAIDRVLEILNFYKLHLNQKHIQHDIVTSQACVLMYICICAVGLVAVMFLFYYSLRRKLIRIERVLAV